MGSWKRIEDGRVSTKSEPLAHCGIRSAALVEDPAILGGEDRCDRRGPDNGIYASLRQAG